MSSISPLPSATSWSTGNTQNDPRAKLRQLAKDIGSGDLSAAQQDFASLTSTSSDTSGSPLSSTVSSSASPLSADFSAIGTALGAGDIQGAQSALTTMETDAQKLHGHGHHHHHRYSQQPPPVDPTATSTDTSTTGTTKTPTSTLNVTV